MGSFESLPKDINTVNSFNNLISSIKSRKNTIYSQISKNIPKLLKNSQNFFKLYNDLQESGRICGDLKSNFKRIEDAIGAFNECFEFIYEMPHSDEVTEVTRCFITDFNLFIDKLNQFLSTIISLMENILVSPAPALMTLFYLELQIFDFSLNVKKLNILPFYSITSLLMYGKRNEIHNLGKKYVSIVAPHLSGKTTLVPIQLACKFLYETKQKQIIIVVVHNVSQISHIKKTYRQILFNPNYAPDPEFYVPDDEAPPDSDIYDYDDVAEENIMVTSSVNRLKELDKNRTYFPVIGVLSPIDALNFIHSIDDLKKSFKNTTFIIDDVQMRTVETDVLFQDITSVASSRDLTGGPKIILMSTFEEEHYLKYFGRSLNEIKIEIDNHTVDMRRIPCKSTSKIMSHLYSEMFKFFNNWMGNELLGSVVIFVPNEEAGLKVHNEIYKYYNKDNSQKIYPLKSKLKRGEKPSVFYERLTAELKNAENERLLTVEEHPDDKHAEDEHADDAQPTLFLMPFNGTGHITEEERELIRSRVPSYFIDKMVRVFITTIENESLFYLDDLMVVFDTGIKDVEYFDPNQSVIHYCQKTIPNSIRNEHYKFLKDGFYYDFYVKDQSKNKAYEPYIQRGDLGPPILSLKSFGINLEKQMNLPNEPNSQLFNNIMKSLIKIGILNDTANKELTEIGKEVAKYTFISPFYSLATAKFVDRKEFAFLCSLIIENSRQLVIDSQAELLVKNFNRESDIVTILNSIYEFSKNNELNDDYSGMSSGMIELIYSEIGSVFNKDGKESVIQSVEWARSQPGGVLGAVDKFIQLLDNEFLAKRKGSFIHVLNAGPRNEPTLVYRINEIFKFEDTEPTINFVRRPGWNGLQSPGNIIILSIFIDEERKKNLGYLIHHDISCPDDNPGVVGVPVDQSLNSFFFVSLFEAYWSDISTEDSFIKIYHSSKPKKDRAFLIHMTENKNRTFMNYCPRNAAVTNIMQQAIPLLSSLMPYVARSVISKIDVPLCAVEVLGIGISENYTTNVLLITEPDTDLPYAYPINKVTLEYAAHNINYLKKVLPLIRFSITGECFYYKSIRGKEVDNDIVYPDVSPSVKSVFDPYHPSHLVLIVDKHFANKPPIPPLPWITNSVKSVENPDFLDTDDNPLLVTVASKIMTGLGYAERSADIFFVSLGGGYPTCSKGNVPERIRQSVDFSAAEGNAIKGGIYPLVKAFVRDFTRKKELNEPIQLHELGSTTHYNKGPKTDRDRENLCNQIGIALKNHFGLTNDVDVSFLGQSLLAIQMVNLPLELIKHKVTTETWNNSCQKCKADDEILKVLQDITSYRLEVTGIVHEPTIGVCIRHMQSMRISRDNFVEKVKKAAESFGFLMASKPEYTEGADDEKHRKSGMLGEIGIDFIGLATGIVFASMLSKEFPISSDANVDYSTTISGIGITTLNPRLGSMPVLLNQKAIKIAKEEADELLQQIRIKGKKKWKINSDYNILIIPESDEAAMKEMLRNLRNEEEDTTCLFTCEPPQEYLPSSLLVYNKDGSVRTVAICKQCMHEFFLQLDDLQFVINPVTHLVDRHKLANLTANLKGIPSIDVRDSEEVDNELWPQIPMAQLLYSLMSDPVLIAPNVKSWFTVVIDFIVRRAVMYFSYCPNHPDFPHRTPKPGYSLACPYCDMMLCDSCKNWHSKNSPCPAADGSKRCPNCSIPVFKYDGCNHITCKCGKHWCYKCDRSAIYETAHDCYTHMTEAHGGYFT